MGMFDDVHVKDDDRFVCSQGHRAEHLQTKDFECLLNTVTVEDGKLATSPSSLSAMVDSQASRYEADDYTGTFDAYSFCEQCETVTSRKDGSNRRITREAWIEFRVTAKAGRVEAVERTSQPTGPT